MKKVACMLWCVGSLSACAARATPIQAPPSVETWPAAQLYQNGLTLLAQGELTRAEQYLASALRAGHDPHATMQALLTVTIRASRLRSALAYAEPFLSAHPRDVALRQLVGSLHLALGDLPRAEQELAHVMRVSDQSAEAHYLMALVLARQRAPLAEQHAHLARYLDISPEGVHAEEARAALAQPAPD
jgi:predicted Zn-dependent protease